MREILGAWRTAMGCLTHGGEAYDARWQGAVCKVARCWMHNVEMPDVW